MLTGLSNPDGNRANHEAGICLPHFMLNFTSSCILTLRPKYASAAYISLLQTGHEADGSRILPLASDPALKVNEYVNHHVGYYYLEPRRCPQVYSARLKGAKLLAAGECCKRVPHLTTEHLPDAVPSSSGLVTAGSGSTARCVCSLLQAVKSWRSRVATVMKYTQTSPTCCARAWACPPACCRPCRLTQTGSQ